MSTTEVGQDGPQHIPPSSPVTQPSQLPWLTLLWKSGDEEERQGRGSQLCGWGSPLPQKHRAHRISTITLFFQQIC